MRTSKQWTLSESQKQSAVQMYEAGLSIGKIAPQFGVSRQSMWDVLRRRTAMRDRVEALPRKSKTAIRAKRKATLERYRSRAARITRAQERTVRERDRVCVICGATGEDIDHITPVSGGGQTVLANLQLLCHPCHVHKTRGEVRQPEASAHSSTCCAEASRRDPARTSPSPARVSESKDPARVFGGSLQGSLGNYDPVTSSLRTSQLSLLGGSTECLRTLPRAGSMRSGTIYRRLPLAPLTDVIEFGSLATPQARDWRTGEQHRYKNPERSNDLNDQIGGSLNPTWVEWLQGFPLGWTAVD